jgi:hypothetical protein
MGAIVENGTVLYRFSQNGTVFHLKEFVNFLINLKIIKIIIIKNKKY